MTLALALALLSLLPPAYREERAGYVEQLSSAIVEASNESAWPGDHDELSAMLGTLAFFESGLTPRIQAGNCYPNECDGLVRLLDGRRGPKAITAFQIQTIAFDRREYVLGLDPSSLLEASREAASLVAQKRKRCGRVWEACVIRSYAGSIGFDPRRRVAVYRRVLRKVREP